MKVINNPFDIKIKRSLDSQRVGSIFDGGYVLTYKSIVNSDFLISGGLHYNFDFEYEFYKINSHSKFVLIDGSLGLKKLFIGVFVRPLFLMFFRRFNLNGYIDLLKSIEILSKHGLIRKYINTKYNISNIINKYQFSNKIGVLKLDIEYSEYEILDDIVKNKNLFSAILIEFHQTHLIENRDKINKFYHQLGFQCVDIAINELGGFEKEIPIVVEMSFVNPIYISDSLPFQNRVNHPSKELVVIE
jgi:hypothetical protein